MGKGVWVVRTGTNSMKHSRRTEDMVPYERDITEPAPTVDGKAGSAWKIVGNNTVAGGPLAERSSDEPAMTVGSRADLWRWAEDRPATTIVGSFCPDVVAAPGYPVTGSRQNAEGSIKITEQDALVLQSFDPDYPLQGSRSKKFEQVGNAVPPLLAAHVVAALTGAQIAERAA